MPRHKPEEVFPEEIIKAHKQGMPLPDFYSGQLYEGDDETKELALEALKQIRERATLSEEIESTDNEGN